MVEILGQKSVPSNMVMWIVYGGIFVYYIIATLFPIDKIIGKVYPIFGGILHGQTRQLRCLDLRLLQFICSYTENHGLYIL